MSNKRKIFFVSNFRYNLDPNKSFQKSRIDFVHWIDKIIDTLNDDYKCKSINFSGQSSFIEDYLEIRPETERDLKRLISEKRIIVGPWYTLPNEFLVSPESIIRNLMLGHIMSESFGNVLKVGYSENSFGLISQLPQILMGFGINTLVINNQDYSNLEPKFLWYSADKKTNILVINLYNNVFMINKNVGMDTFIDSIKDSKDNIIVNNFNSFDKEELNIINFIENINDNSNDIKLIHGSFAEYIEKINLDRLNMPDYYGEIKNPNHLSSYILSSRIYMKQMNTEVQLLIEKWLEPFCTLDWLETGKPYPKAFIWYAWKCLLKNHSYCDINGCGVDEVHHDSILRYEWVRQIGEQLTYSSLKDLADNITSLPQKSFVIFNPLAWERFDPISLKLIASNDLGQIVVKNADGERIPSQVTKGEEGILELSIQAKIPPLGYACYYIEPERQMTVSRDMIKVSPRVMENQFYKIKINGNGTLDILDKSTGYEYKSFNIYEDTGWVDDSVFVTSKQMTIYTNRNSKADVRIMNNSAIKADAEIKFSMNLPKGLTKDKKNRTTTKLSCPIITRVTLYTKFPRIDIAVTFENKVEDHCLRVSFPINLKVEAVNVDGHFDVVSRIINTAKEKEERFMYNDHQNFFIDISDGKKGIAFINRGLPEYEIVKTKDRCILYLTLLKCVGCCKDSTKFIPSTQYLGIHKFYYSIIPHEGSWISAEIQRRAYEYNVRPMAIFNKNGDGLLPKSQSFFSVEPPQLILTALKKCEFGDGVILRLFNSSDEDIEGIIKTHKHVNHACLTNLNEQPLTDSDLKVEDKNVFIKLNRKEIRTIRLIY